MIRYGKNTYIFKYGVKITDTETYLIVRGVLTNECMYCNPVSHTVSQNNLVLKFLSSSVEGSKAFV